VGIFQSKTGLISHPNRFICVTKQASIGPSKPIPAVESAGLLDDLDARRAIIEFCPAS
jgi:hypothetical protein